MHKFGRYFAVAITITIVFLVNTVNVAFSPMLLREDENTQELSIDKGPMQSNSDFYSKLQDTKNRKPYNRFQNLWGFDILDKDTRLDGIEDWGDFACVDEDSAELVIGVDNAEP